jgi:hypothetical protein
MSTEITTSVVELPELRSVPDRLLEVIADDLVEFAGSLAGPLLEPAGVPLVQHRAPLLRDRIVGRVSDHQVAKAERPLSREDWPLGTDQLLAHE